MGVPLPTGLSPTPLSEAYSSELRCASLMHTYESLAHSTSTDFLQVKLHS